MTETQRQTFAVIGLFFVLSCITWATFVPFYLYPLPQGFPAEQSLIAALYKDTYYKWNNFMLSVPIGYDYLPGVGPVDRVDLFMQTPSGFTQIIFTMLFSAVFVATLNTASYLVAFFLCKTWMAMPDLRRSALRRLQFNAWIVSQWLAAGTAFLAVLIWGFAIRLAYEAPFLIDLGVIGASGLLLGQFVCVACIAGVVIRHRLSKLGSVLPHCSQCGYSIRGLRGTKCPECGCESIAPTHVPGSIKSIIWRRLRSILIVVGIVAVVVSMMLTPFVFPFIRAIGII